MAGGVWSIPKQPRGQWGSVSFNRVVWAARRLDHKSVATALVAVLDMHARSLSMRKRRRRRRSSRSSNDGQGSPMARFAQLVPSEEPAGKQEQDGSNSSSDDDGPSISSAASAAGSYPDRQDSSVRWSTGTQLSLPAAPADGPVVPSSSDAASLLYSSSPINPTAGCGAQRSVGQTMACLVDLQVALQDLNAELLAARGPSQIAVGVTNASPTP